MTILCKIVAEVDETDYKAVRAAIARRLTFGKEMSGVAPCLPDGEGDMDGRALAEICRGWQEFCDLPKKGIA